LLEANHPRVLHLGVYANEGGEATAVQVHPTQTRWSSRCRVISGRHEQWYEFIDWSKLRIQDLGTPSDILVRRMGQAAGPDVPRSVNTPLGGFNRLPEL
jgi:hypothetical protein